MTGERRNIPDLEEEEIKRRDGYVRKPGGNSASQQFTWQWHWGVWMCQRWSGVGEGNTARTGGGC